MRIAASNKGSFTVGDWRIEPESDRIMRDCETRYLRPQVMELLVYLAKHQGRVVSSEELLDDLWAGKIVTGSTVYNCVAELRNALTDDQDAHPYIETIPKKGYRLRAAVTGLGDSAGTSNDRPTPEPELSPIVGYRRIGSMAVAVAGLLLVAWLAMDFVLPNRPDSQSDRSVRRFTIDLPKSLQIGDFRPRPLTVSADGRTVIFYARSKGRSQLYSRSIDSLDVQPIPGTENTTRAHAISPDGQWIAFVDISDDMVKKVPVTGGVPVILAGPIEVIWDMAWSPNKDIVLEIQDYAGLQRVSSSGGSLEKLTSPGPGEFHKQPSFSPDGNTLLFAIGERGATMRKSDRIAAMSLNTGDQKVLMAGASPTVTPNGYLVYFARNILWAVEFDSDRLEVTGNPVPSAENILYAVDAHYSISRDGTLVYRLTTNFLDRRLVWVDLFGNEEALDIEPRPYWWPRISPDGDSIAVVVDCETGADLWIYSIADGKSTRLTFDESRETNPVWSPDGRYVIYSSDRVDNLFRVATDGMNEIEQLTDSPNFQHPTAVSRDGSNIFYQEWVSVAKKDDLFVLTLSDPPTTEILLQTEFRETGATLSPDGRWLTYQSNRSGQDEVYLRPYPDIHAGRWQVSVGGGLRPLWDPSGKRLFYTGPSRVMSVSVETEADLIIGKPEPAFKLEPYMYLRGFGFDWDSNRERFLMVKHPSEDELPRNRIVVVQNWLDFVTEELAHD